MQSKGYASHGAKEALVPFSFERRELNANDVAIDIEFCGVCHSDIHTVRGDWGPALWPLVPGHEIVGKVRAVGSAVKKFKVGQTVGVGCMVDSCQTCHSCHQGYEQYCEQGFTGTYNSNGKDGRVTQGGYSNNIVVREEFVLSVGDNLDLKAVAPLLCAGITTYSPLKHWNVGPGKKVGVVGLGGLGHMAVKLARAFGAEVTVFSTSENKKQDALRLGAHKVIISKDPEQMKSQIGQLDFILDTVSAPHDVNAYLQCLRLNGAMVLVGVPETPHQVHAFSLIPNRRTLAGSLIGGIKETQDMLDFCAKHNITSDIELIPIQKINEAYERVLKADVKYRFVIDMKTL